MTPQDIQVSTAVYKRMDANLAIALEKKGIFDLSPAYQKRFTARVELRIAVPSDVVEDLIYKARWWGLT